MNHQSVETWQAGAPALQIRGLRKSFAAPVLRDFDLTVRAGEVHALVGSNGAGKSTLARILAGLLTRDGGEVTLAGKPFRPRSRREAQAAGVTLMLQELNVLPTLSVAENIFLTRLPQRWGFVDRRRLFEGARTALACVGLEHLPPGTLAARLGVGQRQQVELATALATDCRWLILDEPTAALTTRETEKLFENIRALRARGVGILYVSHRMDELRAIADTVSVMRDGQRVETRPMVDASTAELVRLMAGREIVPMANASSKRALGGVALAVRDLHAGTAVRGVDFEVRRGEILGLAGLVGAGRTETLRAVFGADARERGRVEIAGRPVNIRGPADAVAAGLALVPEDRKDQGLLLPQSLRVNLTLAALPGHQRAGLMSRRTEAQSSRRIIERLAVRCDTPEQPVAALSGGNQQKIVLGRWLLRSSGVLLLDEPTRGVDAAAKASIYALLHELADEGKSCVVVSSELPELMTLCDRIAVMSAGRVMEEFLPDEWTLEKLTAAAFRGHLATSME